MTAQNAEVNQETVSLAIQKTQTKLNQHKKVKEELSQQIGILSSIIEKAGIQIYSITYEVDNYDDDNYETEVGLNLYKLIKKLYYHNVGSYDLPPVVLQKLTGYEHYDWLKTGYCVCTGSNECLHKDPAPKTSKYTVTKDDDLVTRNTKTEALLKKYARNSGAFNFGSDVVTKSNIEEVMRLLDE